VVIASSTGGPRALYTVIPSLPADLAAAVVVVQHMPAGFTRSLAERLNDLSALSVKEAVEGDALREGRILVAPGGYHLSVARDFAVKLSLEPPIWGLRPAADVTLAAIARHFGVMTVCVVLTGMGSDGTRGAGMVKAAGGQVLAQDEASCVVYGMPRSVVESGVADRVLPLNRMAEEITQTCNACAEVVS